VNWLARWLPQLWYRPGDPRRLPLLPFSWLFRLLAALRRSAYRYHLLAVHQPPLPLIVVGNLTVGGSGKTPLVAALALRLQQQGLRVGLLSRGYGAAAGDWPRLIDRESDVAVAGDEPLLLAQRTGCRLAIGPDRVAALEQLLAAGALDLVIADDGLQHYRLGRQLELVVIDGRRGFGNGHLLPAGPLREPVTRLQEADWLVINGPPAAPLLPFLRRYHQAEPILMQLHPEPLQNLQDPQRRLPLAAWQGERIHAVAGIAHPERFFTLLRHAGIEPIPHPFGDHHRFQPADIQFDDALPVVMTEKDAVKCRPFADRRHWYLPVAAELPEPFITALLAQLQRYGVTLPRFNLAE